ncbi:hypothetical protein LZ518_11390 [Sphingomonas sp. RB56-2]|uniref:Uncharacterized protein n=1 Tax=Sphingomonas brevis TaxID=2908206 RepID=A0ABT0SBE3_9SPHN|nr:hypothetical protein [Sphingomonas brevis]MCL6741730.1 hypothetical protein [Sphingomonas brevis]
MTRQAALMISAIFLASCGKNEPAAQPVQNDIVVRSSAQQQLFDLNDLDRAIALKRAIADQGLRCGQMVSTGYVTRFKDMDMWTATCSDKRQWALFIAANDSVQVRLCDDNEKIGLPACKVQPGTEGGTGLDQLNLANAN